MRTFTYALLSGVLLSSGGCSSLCSDDGLFQDSPDGCAVDSTSGGGESSTTVSADSTTSSTTLQTGTAGEGPGESETTAGTTGVEGSSSGSTGSEPSCEDEVLNGDETDVDCGGATCSACDDGSTCESSGDCASGVCDADAGTCTPAACDDGVQNGDESDVDCGGTTCDACDDGSGCAVGTDCISGVCDPDTATCTPAACDDGVQNGDETDVDCGGATCETCDDGSGCGADADCTSGICDPGAMTCVAATCADGVQNGDETDVDCGGDVCLPCDDGEGCGDADDCASSVCDGGTMTCSAPACDDGVQNGDETDVDCGGDTCAACSDGEGCSDAGDCESGVCDGGTMTCSAPACDDGVQNGTETSVDCGGTCLCDEGDPCVDDADCASNLCDTGASVCISTTCSGDPCNPSVETCPAPACDDGIQNGDETGLDCGGSCAACGTTCVGTPARWNPADAQGNIEFLDDDRTVTVTAASVNDSVRANTALQSGRRYYWEVTAAAGGFSWGQVGTGDDTFSLEVSPNGSNGTGLRRTGSIPGVGSTCLSYAPGDVIGVAIDVDALEGWIHVNGQWALGSPTETTGFSFGVTAAAELFPALTLGQDDVFEANFGQSPFVYAVPPGFEGGVCAP